jgi:4-amino-4-deoxy-L-arabinose transferase-like glycosyltransferase
MKQSIQFSKYNLFYLICGIWLIGLIFRLFYYDETIPLNMDALFYFMYSVDITSIGKLPENYDIAKPGWSYLLGVVFSIFNFEYTMQYMQLQKLLSISISSLTVFPLFFLIKKFSQSKYALLGVLIFAVEPRIIQNSLSGNAESIFIFFIVTTILLFLNKNNKIIYLSFLFAGIATIIRPEGLFLFIGISISYIIRFRKTQFVIPKYIFALIIFILILTPVILHKEQEGMNDTVFQRAYFTLLGDDNYKETIITLEVDSSQKNDSIFISTTEQFLKYLGWILIPLFIILAPIGFVLFFKNFNTEKLTIIILTISMTMPALYAYSLPLLELKYLYFLFPMFCIFATFSLKPIFEKFKRNNILFLIFFILILSSSILFTDYKFDYQKEHEAVIIAEYVVKNTKVINSYYPESRHILGIQIVDNWKNLQEFFQNNESIPKVNNVIEFKKESIITFVNPNNYQTLDSFLNNSENKKITHLILDGSNSQPDFLIEIFYDEQKYDFIEKIYDSKDNNLEYHVKIFQVN